MKRIFLALVMAALCLAPLSATSNFFALGVDSIIKLEDPARFFSGPAFTYTFNSRGVVGFHMQLSYELLIAESHMDTDGSYRTDPAFGYGFEGTFGIGSDLNFGSAGFLVGGGLYASAFIAVSDDYDEDFVGGFRGGVAGDISFYVHFNPERRFVFHCGASVAWCPLSITDGIYTTSEAAFQNDIMRVKAYIGVGFHT